MYTRHPRAVGVTQTATGVSADRQPALAKLPACFPRRPRQRSPGMSVLMSPSMRGIKRGLIPAQPPISPHSPSPPVRMPSQVPWCPPQDSCPPSSIVVAVNWVVGRSAMGVSITPLTQGAFSASTSTELAV